MKQTLGNVTLSLALASVLGACSGTGTNANSDGGNNPDLYQVPTVTTVVDYEQALRSAALKLTGNYPTLTEIQTVRNASDQKTAYTTLIDDYLGRPTFAIQMVDYWKDQFKMGGNLTVGAATVMMDYAPNFAASLVVGGKPIKDVVTATSNTCQNFDATAGTFSNATCPNAAAVGVLTDAGVQAQFFSNMAFRRVRWVQETFACAKFPAETNGPTEQHPGGAYVSPWPFSSITGSVSATAPKIDFQDDKSIICANCHATMNHQAPLFAKFSMAGAPMAAIQVQVPVTNTPIATMLDWLPAAEVTSWRYQKPTADIAAFGAAIADDPVFNTCMVTRVWNWAMSRPNVVEDGAVLTPELATQLTTELVSNNGNLKKSVRSVFTSDSFVHF